MTAPVFIADYDRSTLGTCNIGSNDRAMVKRISFAARLYEKRPRWNAKGQIIFTLSGVEYTGVVDLIEMVLDRYSRRFGPIMAAQAWDLHLRLAYRYSRAPGSVHRALTNRIGHGLTAYPISRRIEEANWSWIQLTEEGNARRERRQFTPKSRWDLLRNRRPVFSQRFINQMDSISQDNSNLRECRKLLRQLKDHLNENT